MIIFITGATAGFGAAMVKRFIHSGHKVIATGRRQERLDEMKKEYGDHLYPLVLDVQNKEMVAKAIDSLPVEWKKIDVLINNAGLALGTELAQKANLDDWDTMLDTNVKGMMYVTKAVLPYMTARKKGHIINMGSVAGKEVYKDGNIYCAANKRGGPSLSFGLGGQPLRVSRRAAAGLAGYAPRFCRIAAVRL